ncbi:hypothetical protein Zmor_005080 [Zophobas morio]|uniref:Uncharacterized protein n=1 Tax=Zophobas morio TaxID=2755281 RepID=A0AA38IUN2_9CUCU|nr:hypothetical protein Zmor_005080 [Zophobas morio]
MFHVHNGSLNSPAPVISFVKEKNPRRLAGIRKSRLEFLRLPSTLRHRIFIILLWVVVVVAVAAIKCPPANCLWGRRPDAGGGCQWRRLPQDEWTLRDALVLQCDLPSQWPRWSAVGGACAVPARPAKAGPDLSVQYASRRVCPPLTPPPPPTCTCWNAAGPKDAGSVGLSSGGLRRSFQRKGAGTRGRARIVPARTATRRSILAFSTLAQCSLASLGSFGSFSLLLSNLPFLTSL